MLVFVFVGNVGNQIGAGDAGQLLNGRRIARRSPATRKPGVDLLRRDPLAEMAGKPAGQFGLRFRLDPFNCTSKGVHGADTKWSV